MKSSDQFSADQPILTVVIPTHGRPQKLRAVLEPLQQLDHSLIEIIIVENGSSAADKASYQNVVLNTCRPLKFLSIAEGNACAARNLGFERSSGKYIWFIDDDDYAAEILIRDIIFQLSEIADWFNILSLPVNQGGGTKWMDEDALRFETLRRHPNRIGNAGVVVIRRDLLSGDSWDVNLEAGQDTDFFLHLSRRKLRIARLCSEQPFLIDHHSDGYRITTDWRRQQRAKIQFLLKNYDLLHPFRSLRYVLTFILMVPYWKTVFSLWPRSHEDPRS